MRKSCARRYQVDCCRHSLFYPDLASLIAGLRAIAADPDAELVHVKNRLSPAHDVRVTAGYRDVLVNLRLRTEAARRLNLDHHVWELQLMLISFARIKVCASVAVAGCRIAAPVGGFPVWGRVGGPWAAVWRMWVQGEGCMLPRYVGGAPNAHQVACNGGTGRPPSGSRNSGLQWQQAQMRTAMRAPAPSHRSACT